MKQFLAWPIGFELNFDKNRHSVRVMERFWKKRISLSNDIEAAISETESGAIKDLLSNAESYFSNLRNVHSTIVAGDIEFCYMVREITSGKILISQNMVMRKTV